MLERYFPKQTFKAFLFDFDGTIADTMPAHLEAWNQALKIYNLTLTREQHLEWAGRPTRQIVELLNQKHGTKIEPDIFVKAKETDYLASISQVRAINSVVDIIKHYHGKIPMAVVSGSRHKPVEMTLAQLQLAHYFDVLVCAEDYVRGKPDPDCFLLAAEKLKVKPAECLVFEDASLGIESAKRAGMACIRVTDQHELANIE
jgi:HAD superfamily hydrolase (TIGR01509 family)